MVAEVSPITPETACPGLSAARLPPLTVPRSSSPCQLRAQTPMSRAEVGRAGGAEGKEIIQAITGREGSGSESRVASLANDANVLLRREGFSTQRSSSRWPWDPVCGQRGPRELKGASLSPCPAPPRFVDGRPPAQRAGPRLGR